MKVNTLTVIVVTLFLVTGGIGAAAQLSAANTGAANTSAPPTDSYVIEQGEFCQEIEPLSTNGTVESFYDYRNHETHPEDVDRMYSSYGTTHLQEDDTSILFLHEGTDGLSLVMIHDQVDGDTSGGVASFDIVGLPDEAEWVVQDDLYEGDTNMVEWGEGDGWASADWIWQEARTDGGAIQGGLNDEFDVTIHPAFNEEAAYYENENLHDPDFYDDGKIYDWDVLSGDVEDPDRTAIPSDEDPVTIRTGTCDDPSVTYERTDNGLTASIEGATADDRITLETTAGTTDGVTFETVELTGVEGSGTVTFENLQPNGLPDSPSGADSLSHLTVSSDVTHDGAATVTFSIDKDALDESDLDAEDVALYEADGDEWVEADTTVQDETAPTYQFTAEVSSLGDLTVAEQQSDSETDSDAESPMPGLEAGAALAAIALLTVLWAVRSRGQ